MQNAIQNEIQNKIQNKNQNIIKNRIGYNYEHCSEYQHACQVDSDNSFKKEVLEEMCTMTYQVHRDCQKV